MKKQQRSTVLGSSPEACALTFTRQQVEDIKSRFPQTQKWPWRYARAIYRLPFTWIANDREMQQPAQACQPRTRGHGDDHFPFGWCHSLSS